MSRQCSYSAEGLRGLYMPMSYTIDPVAGVVRIAGSGLLTDREMVDCIDALRHDPALEPGMNTLSDMRRIEVGFTSAGVESMVEIMRATEERRGDSRAAIVVSEEVAFGMARMFELISENADVHPNFRVFYDFEQATAWLRSN